MGGGLKVTFIPEYPIETLRTRSSSLDHTVKFSYSAEACSLGCTAFRTRKLNVKTEIP